MLTTSLSLQRTVVQVPGMNLFRKPRGHGERQQEWVNVRANRRGPKGFAMVHP